MALCVCIAGDVGCSLGCQQWSGIEMDQERDKIPNGAKCRIASGRHER